MAMLKREQTDVERYGSEVLDALNMLKISEPQPVPTWYIGLIDELTTAIVFLLSAKMVEYDSPESRIKPVQTVVNAGATDGMPLVALAGVPTSLLPDFANISLRSCLTNAQITEYQTQYLHRIKKCITICREISINVADIEVAIKRTSDAVEHIVKDPIEVKCFAEKMEESMYKRKLKRMTNIRSIPFYYGENMNIEQLKQNITSYSSEVEKSIDIASCLSNVEKVLDNADTLSYIIALMSIVVKQMQQVLDYA